MGLRSDSVPVETGESVADSASDVASGARRAAVERGTAQIGRHSFSTTWTRRWLLSSSNFVQSTVSALTFIF